MSREVRIKNFNYLQAPPTQAQIVGNILFHIFNSMADLQFTIFFSRMILYTFFLKGMDQYHRSSSLSPTYSTAHQQLFYNLINEFSTLFFLFTQI